MVELLLNIFILGKQKKYTFFTFQSFWGFGIKFGLYPKTPKGLENIQQRHFETL
jgi:hypothetical protein